MHEEPKRAVYTIPEFCEMHHISRSLFYALLREGKAPRTLQLGRRRQLITVEAAAAWRARMQEAA